MLRIAAEALAAAIRPRAPLVVDLGIGTGGLSAQCLKAMPRARIYGIDADEDMLAAAAARLGRRLISADCHPAAHPRLAARDRGAWLAHLERAYSSSQARGFLRAWAREDHYAALIDEIATLQQAGFRVDVLGR